MSSQIIPILLTSVAVLMGLVMFLFFFEFMSRMGQLLVKQSQELEAEITERKKAQELADTSLKEKELLLREIHHRVKNNFQIVSSLFRLQLRNIDDDRIRTVLRDSQSRIRAMSLIHETLYRPQDISNVNFKDYTTELIANLMDSYNADPERIRMTLEVENVSMDIDTAIPCGLIINELITNCLKYAFPDQRPGEIRVKLAMADAGQYLLTVSDDGIGLPEDLDIFQAKSLGLQLVVNLATGQLGGRLEIDSERNQGTEFVIYLNKMEYKKRV